jgi:hypothetical protein
MSGGDLVNTLQVLLQAHGQYSACRALCAAGLAQVRLGGLSDCWSPSVIGGIRVVMPSLEQLREQPKSLYENLYVQVGLLAALSDAVGVEGCTRDH